MSHFFLAAWPENRPGLLFLTDASGRLLNMVPLQAHQKWKPAAFTYGIGDVMAAGAASVVSKALDSGQLSVAEEAGPGNRCAWAAIPLKEQDGRIRATIGLIVPKELFPYELGSYMQGMEPLIYMGYDAYIKRATSEIVMNANRYHKAKEFVTCVIEQIHEIVDKGCCSAVRLDDRGYVVPQERFTIPAGEDHDRHLSEILPRFFNRRITPTVTDEHRLIVSPVYCEGTPLYAFLLHIPPEQNGVVYDARDVAFLQNVAEKIRNALMRAVISDQIRREERKKDLLYTLTKQIQASIDVNDVLDEIMKSIRQLYPHAEVELYLTVDTNTTLPVKQLGYQTEQGEFSNRAYMEGQLVVGSRREGEEEVTVVAAPLLGKQGVYGVLQLTAGRGGLLLHTETDYISILAETAGTAFENAQLYQQSRNLIRELRLINEMAQQLNRTLNLEEIMQIVSKMMINTFRAQHCAILQRLDESRLIVRYASTEEDMGRVVAASDVPVEGILRERQGVIVAHGQPQTVAYSGTKFASLMGVPIWKESKVSGALIVSDERPHFFSFDDFKLLEIFGQHTSLSITNAMLHNEVERMVRTDNLTGLFARRYLDEQVSHSLEHDDRGSLILIDIDYFKQINDTYGHQVGDEVLMQVAQLVKQCIRDTDIPARWGGEELAVYLPKVDISRAFIVAERIRSCVEAETRPQVTISIGVARWDRQNHHQVSVETLFHQADTALYDAKNRGRNQVRLA
ncbi:sensor domain-containing diguanylate cyclase [Brevibacillus humidisoli]|uniref:GGDEF domain-containing protein n=1 Tax=Brevibacillus humidisoli TaxID=2895522 RepID=UPI001E581E1A|nr:sensor domain-containing diguanylate cyclase [Brevibacillus humidisoli]UFJ41564.1 sensor domain-containing diguanylate cyclase [Brevibacillus humidisoli]